MSASRATDRPAAGPAALHDRAADNLRFIRDTMERAAAFSAISGWGLAAAGMTALGAAAIAARQPSVDAWLATWMAEGLVGLVLALGALAWKARRHGIPLLSTAARRVAWGFLPPICAALPLTLAFYRAGQPTLIPGLWLLLYGAGVVAGGAFSVRLLPAMGACFAGAGIAALFSPATWHDWYMAGGFGGLHIAFGAAIARRHGG